MEVFSMPAFLWLALTVLCLAVILHGLHSVLQTTTWASVRKLTIFWGTAFSLFIWAGVLTILSRAGFFSDFTIFPPRLLLAVLISLPIILFVSFSATGTELLQRMPHHQLVLIQSFRILVEILLWLAFRNSMIPVQMTFEGGNLDIITGLLALPIGYILLKSKTPSRKLVLAFNAIGVLLLLNILTIAVLSMPTPIRVFMNEPANTLVSQFPFVLLPGVLVPIAYSFHIFSLRKLFLERRSNNPQ